MINIAVVTPWPPQHTGIADYAFDLVSGLSKLDISTHVYTDCENPKMLDNVKILQIKSCDPSELRGYDIIIYQMGNNVTFHLYMLDLVKEYGGIVHLHDMVLHHIMGWITWMQNNAESYFNLLEKWYGRNVSLICGDLMKHDTMPWECEVVTDLPLFEELIQYADACIVHSEFARKSVNEALPDLNVYKLTQAYEGMEIIEKKYDHSGKKLKIGIFGVIEPNKHVDVILRSLSDFKEYASSWEAHIVGSVGNICKDIPGIPAKLGIKKNVFFHGRPDSKKFNTLLSDMDIIISLRYPTMGETSAVIARAMQMGIPVIVNNIGWYGELPDFVDKVSVKNTQSELSVLLEKYLFDRNYLKEKKKDFVIYSQTEMDFDKIVRDYFDILMRQHQKECPQRPAENHKVIELASQTLSDLDLCEDLFLEKIVKKLSIIFQNTNKGSKL
ncbi:MAG: glycosyltransferase family 4 protein [Deltaproteobacteria bacterium]|nr:glycosyltransferase family 4 protein [Deltaproteobacteria bacterium]